MRKTISTILSTVAHRPFTLPVGNWRYYQEWNNALFLHWKVPYALLRNHIPEPLEIDSFDGDCYISLVPFTMQQIRPRGLPAVKCISDFHEINIRTYVEYENKKGVYFLNIEAAKPLSVFIAKLLSGLPYRTSFIRRGFETYYCQHPTKEFELDLVFEVGDKIKHKTEIDKWLTERYCLYLEQQEEVFRYDIHHKEWELNQLILKRLNLKYEFSGINLTNHPPHLTHYSTGVRVIAWRKEKVVNG